MSLSRDEILDAIADMSVMEVVELVDAMEQKFGVTAAAPVAVAPAGAGDDGDTGAAAEEQTEFDVKLVGVPERKLNVIKAVREITGLGLKESKALVDEIPSDVKTQISKEEADEIKAKIEDAGGTVEIK